MMPTVNQALMGNTYSRLEKVPLRDAWQQKSVDSALWSTKGNNLMILAGVFGQSELACVAVSHQVGDLKFDALSMENRYQVSLESQLDKTHQPRRGQILFCATSMAARKVIWNNKSFRPEHAAALQLLNEPITAGQSFFPVADELLRVGNSQRVKHSELEVEPHDWVESGREQGRAAITNSTIKQLQMRFWLSLAGLQKSIFSGISPQKPRPQRRLNLSPGKAAPKSCVTANTRKEKIRVKKYIYGSESKNESAILKSNKAKTEKNFDFEPDWQELPEAKACRVAICCLGASLVDESRWVEYLNWIEHRLIISRIVLWPILKALP